MAIFETVIRSDLNRPVQVEKLTGNLFSGDNGGNRITVEIMNNGSPATVSGGVTGYVVRADGETVVVSGTLTGNKASIDLPASAYVVVGAVSIVVKVGTATVGACTSYVYRTTTDTIVDPGSVVPDISELLGHIADCISATAAATSATSAAVSATSQVNSAILAASSATAEALDAAETALTVGLDKASLITEVISTPAEVMTFTDGSSSMPMEVTVAVTPVQDLNGQEYPYPGGGGKNLFDNSMFENGGISTSGININSTQEVRLISKFSVQAGTTYTFSYYSQCDYAFVYYYNGTTYKNRASLWENSGTHGSFTVPASDVDSIRIKFGNNSGSDRPSKENNLQLEIGSSSTVYAPYSNICPITGWTGCTISRTGKNLMGGNTLLAEMTRNNFPYTSMTGGFSFKASNVSNKTFVKGIFKQNTQYTFIFDGYRNSSTGKLNLANKYTDGTFVSLANPGTTRKQTKYTSTSNKSLNKTMGDYSSGTTYVYLEGTGFFEGDVSIEEFEAYKGNEYSIAFPNEAGTVYGGTLKVNKDGTGTLSVDKEIVEFTGDSSEDWTYNAGSGYASLTLSCPSKYGKTQTPIANYLRGVSNRGSSAMNDWDIAISTGYTNIIVRLPETFTSASDWTTYLSTNHLSVVFELVTPTTYTLTASEVGQIFSLYGTNNVWATTGDVNEVSYPADTKLYIDGKITELQALILKNG